MKAKVLHRTRVPLIAPEMLSTKLRHKTIVTSEKSYTKYDW